MTPRPIKVHATCVEIAGAGVLLRGASGVGKSDLALRLMDRSQSGLGVCGPARLVADDQVCLSRTGNTVVASAPDAIAGKFEVRGLGIVEMASSPQAPLALVVDLVAPGEIERFPDDAALRVTLLGVPLARVAIDASAASATARIRATLAHLCDLPPA